MRIPNADKAIITPEKLRDYLLSMHHPSGRTKAAFFIRLGYRQAEWPSLEHDLRTQHLLLDAEEAAESPSGRKFIIRGPLRGPVGRVVDVVSIWIVYTGEEVPHLVTAYPGRRIRR